MNKISDKWDWDLVQDLLGWLVDKQGSRWGVEPWHLSSSRREAPISHRRLGQKDSNLLDAALPPRPLSQSSEYPLVILLIRGSNYSGTGTEMDETSRIRYLVRQPQDPMSLPKQKPIYHCSRFDRVLSWNSDQMYFKELGIERKEFSASLFGAFPSDRTTKATASARRTGTRDPFSASTKKRRRRKKEKKKAGQSTSRYP